MGMFLPVLGVPELFGGGGLPGLDTIANLAHWYNLDDLSRLFQDSAMTTPVTSDSDPVGAWIDQIVAADEVAQAGGGLRPLYRASVAALNNKPALQFDGDDWLQGAWTASLAQPNTILFVGQATSIASTGVFYDGDDSAARHEFFHDAGAWGAQAGTIQSGGTSNTDPVIASTVLNGSGSYLRVNGIQVVAANMGAKPMDGATFGSYFAHLGAWIIGYIAEFAIYSRELSVSEIEKGEAYLADKYAIPLV